MQSKVFHIAYCQDLEEVYIHYWGCNFSCRGCSCKKSIWDWMLNDHLSIRDMEPLAIADFPDNFLMYENILEKLSTLNFKRVFHMGQEASLDPVFSLIA
jgi:pyruvate formate lyase activating enzyme